MDNGPTLSLDKDFAHFELYEHYLVATIHEGVIFDTPELHELIDVFNKHYYNRPFGFISNRKNDYTINPNCYAETKTFDLKIVGIATLCYSQFNYDNAIFGGRFYDWPHKAFFTMHECVTWINSLLPSQSKKAGL